MNIKQLSKVFLLFVSVTMLASVFSVVLPSKPVSAASSSQEKAKAYCDKNYGAPYSKKVYDACIYGYKRGYSGSNSGDCYNYRNSNKDKNSDVYKACAAAKVQGKSDKKASSNAGQGTAPGTSKCGEVTTFFNFACGNVSRTSGGSNNPIFSMLLTIVAWLTAGVMVAVVGGIVYGGFLYMTAQDNASQTQKGITIIVDAVIGLIAFGLMWTILNYVIPGGIYS